MTLISTRLTIIFLVFCIYYCILVAHLYTIGVRNTQYFSTLGTQQYRVTLTAPSARAHIYDRFHEPLALNIESFSAFITPCHLEQPQATQLFLKIHFPHAYARYEKNKKAQFLYVKRHLTPEQQTLITQSKLSDIKLLKEPSRFYPLPCATPVVGITNSDNQGITGLEYFYNSQLAGTPTTYIIEKDARSGHGYFKRHMQAAGSCGQPLTLTLDSTLQFLVSHELKQAVHTFGAQEGSASIINPTNGDILALATYPDTAPDTPNRPAADTYEFGSVIKVFLALAALEEQIVTPQTSIDCENTTTITLDSISFTTCKPHGIISFEAVIQFSNNIGVAKIAQKLGPKLYEHYTRLGFGTKLGIFPAEPKGFVNPPAYWSKASPFSLSFGYEISATLLQLAQAFSVITQDGLYVPLHIIAQSTTPTPIRLYTEHTVQALKEILCKTVTHGTARHAAIEGYKVYGKTGTARLLTNGKYDPNRHIFTFMGALEKDQYKRIIITCIKETTQKNAYASTTAVPLFKNIAEQLIVHDLLTA
jgi:cell division protein FtsI (penicillin-binding protein 3)